MRHTALSFAMLALAASTCAQFTEKGTHDGVEIAYRWKHPPGKPSELLVRLRNMSDGDRRISLGIDLYYQGRTIETFEADTCMRAGMVLNGRLNGFYFIPQRLTAAQIKDGGADVEVTRTEVTQATCR
jgi:hypothetical protein